MAEGGYNHGLSYERRCVACKNLTCSKILPCGHECCITCLGKQLNGKKVECPSCKHVKILDELTPRLEDLPETFKFEALREKLTYFLSAGQRTDLLFQPCVSCSQPGIYICVSCKIYLCSACGKKHCTQEINETNNLVAISRWTICRAHTFSKPLINGYCKTCEVGLCSTCRKSGHKDHNLVTIDDKELLMSHKKHIIRHKDCFGDLRLEMFQKGLKQHREETQNQYSTVAKKLEEMKTNTKSAEQMKNMIATLREKEKAFVKECYFLEDDIKAIITTRDLFITSIDQMISRGYPAEIILASREVPDLNCFSCPELPLVDQPSVDDVLLLSKTHNSESQVSSLISTTPGRKVSKSFSFSQYKTCMEMVENQTIEATGHYVFDRKVYLEDGYFVTDVMQTHGGDADLFLRAGTFSFAYYFVPGELLSIKGQQITTESTTLFRGGTMCFDSKRNLIVTTDQGKSLHRFCTKGSEEQRIRLPGCASTLGVTFIPKSDTYVVSDRAKQCVLFVNADTFKVYKTITCYGPKCTPFLNPGYLTYYEKDDIIFICNYKQHCIVAMNSAGEFITSYGTEGYSSSELYFPSGIRVDARGRLLVCDRKNKRVVRFWRDTKNTFDVILTADDLDYRKPCCIDVSDDSKVIIVGFWGKKKYIKRFNLTNT